MQDWTDFFNQLFLNTTIWGYFGVLGIVIVGAWLMNKNKALGILYFVFEALIIGEYFTLAETNAAYYWHAIILLLGAIFTCLMPLSSYKPKR